MSSAVTPDPEIEALLDPLWAQLDALLSGVIGQSTVAVPRSVECGQSSGRHCESLIGDVVTDAMRGRYGTDFAITNSGGPRADLTSPDPDVPGDFCPRPMVVISRSPTAHVQRMRSTSRRVLRTRWPRTTSWPAVVTATRQTSVQR